MEAEMEKPEYAKPVHDLVTRLLVFETEGREVAVREFERYGLRVVAAWTDDVSGKVSVNAKGDLAFKVRPGHRVFAQVRSA